MFATCWIRSESPLIAANGCESLRSSADSDRCFGALQPFYFLGIESQLKKLLEDPKISPYLFLPPPRVDPPAGGERIVRNIYESDGWHIQVTQGQGRKGVPESARIDFSTEHEGRNIVLSLNVDGFQPFEHVQHSLTPMVCMILNLPENLRHRSEYLLLVGLIPGPREPKDWNTYLKFVVDELKKLWHHGFEFQDPCLKQIGPVPTPPTRVRVKLLTVCADLPAFGHLLRQQIAPAMHGCIKCHLVGSHDKAANTTLYDHYHELSEGDLPELRTLESIQSDALKAAEFAVTNPKDKFIEAGSRGVRGRSILMDLPYFDLTRDCVLDMMHISSGVVGRAFATLLTGARLKKAVSSNRLTKQNEAKLTDEQRLAAANAPAVKAAAAQQLEAKKHATALQQQATKRRAIGQATTAKKRKLLQDLEAMEATEKNRVEQSARLTSQASGAAAAAAAAPPLVSFTAIHSYLQRFAANISEILTNCSFFCFRFRWTTSTTSGTSVLPPASKLSSYAIGKSLHQRVSLLRPSNLSLCNRRCSLTTG